MRSTSSVPDDALHDLLARFSACGETGNGGITRLCGSPADGAARDLFGETVRALGGGVRVDAVGNQFGLFRLAEGTGAPLVMMGSHLDSQVQAGCLDGTLGVAAALCVAGALMQAARAGTRFDADFCAVNWTNEEGARFRPSLLGSGTYAGRHAVAETLACRDESGIALGDALAAIGYLGTDAAPALPACYLELHVEQGTILEEAGATIGIVTRNWGATKIEAVFMGEQAHTGPCPMERRRDALLGAAYAIAEVRALVAHWPARLHTSVGRIVVHPNSANVVPSRVELSVEIRSADDTILVEAGRRVDAILEAAAERARVDLAVPVRAERPIRALPEAVCALVALCAEETGHPGLRMDTVAGHDALSLLGACPTGVVFVPSLGGVAHNEAEATAPADLDAGLAVLLRAAHRLCRAGGDPVAAVRLDLGDPV